MSRRARIGFAALILGWKTLACAKAPGMEEVRDAAVPDARVRTCSERSAIRSLAPWPTFRGCPDHAGHSDYVGRRPTRVRWTFAASDAIHAAPTIAVDGTLAARQEPQHKEAQPPCPPAGYGSRRELGLHGNAPEWSGGLRSF